MNGLLAIRLDEALFPPAMEQAWVFAPQRGVMKQLEEWLYGLVARLSVLGFQLLVLTPTKQLCRGVDVACA